MRIVFPLQQDTLGTWTDVKRADQVAAHMLAHAMSPSMPLQATETWASRMH